MKFSCDLTSLIKIVLSLLPEAISDPFQEEELTLLLCPGRVLTYLH